MKMAKTTNPQINEFLHGKFLKFDIQAINQELRQFWIEAQDNNNNNQLSTTRACSNNLIILSDDFKNEDNLADLIDNIMLYNPCRAILAICAAACDDSFEAYASARCHLIDSNQKKQVCSEQITLKQAYSNASAQNFLKHSLEMASAIASLILQDLPVIMWWHSNTFSQQYFQPFGYFIDTLIIDTAKIFNSSAENLYEFKDCLKLPVIDLTATRLLPWRKSIAYSLDAFFKSDSIKFTSVRIINNKPAKFNYSYEALYLATWFTTLLNLKFVRKIEATDLCLIFDRIEPVNQYINHELPIYFSCVPNPKACDNNIVKISIFFEHNNDEKNIEYEVSNNEIKTTFANEQSLSKICLNNNLIIQELLNSNHDHTCLKTLNQVIDLLKVLMESHNA